MGILSLMKALFSLRKVKILLMMRHIRVALGFVIAISCFVTLLLYYWYHTPSARHYKIFKSQRDFTAKYYIRKTNIPMKHIPLDQIYSDESKSENISMSFEETDYNKRAFFINTPGCQIPVAIIDYGKYKKRVKTCGKRAVFLKKFDEDNIRVSIKGRAMRKYLRRSANFKCCYSFMRRSSHVGRESSDIEYTACKKIKDGDIFPLESDFVNVKCYEYDIRNVTHIMYSDAYVFIKKVKTPSSLNTTNKYNILMIGMDSMSLSRTTQTMSRTVHYFQENSWLGFRGYHKVADNTLPNLFAALTGQKLSMIPKKCLKKMDDCNDMFIWSKFKKLGYITAYGEDYLRLPDTFSKEYAFKKPPTDHYLRSFYLHGEQELFNKSLVCTGKSPSGQHLLNYAIDFAITYRFDSFFGLFWMNSYSHNVNSHPQDADKMFENFFNQLSYTGILENTFIIFFSDHGIRFGQYRVQPEAYYEERMPALFMSLPVKFVGRHHTFFKAVAINQFRLLTPYDLYNTLVNIANLKKSSSLTEGASEACVSCHSMFKTVSVNRTCEDVDIHIKWCSCHRLYPLDTQDAEGMKSVIFAANHIKSMIVNINTDKCWSCMKLSINTVLRIHFYYYKNNMYYVVAFTMTPGNVSYEATISKRNNTSRHIIGAVSVISVYRGLGKCVVHKKDRLFCFCQRKETC